MNGMTERKESLAARDRRVATILALGLREMLQRVHSVRDEFRHLWRRTRFVIHTAPKQGTIADLDAARDLSRILGGELGKLRVLEADVIEDVAFLGALLGHDETGETGGQPAEVDRGQTDALSVWRALRSAHPAVLHDALSTPEVIRDRGTDQLLSPEELGQLSLVTATELSGWATSLPPKGRGDLTPDQQPEAVVRHLCAWSLADGSPPAGLAANSDGAPAAQLSQLGKLASATQLQRSALRRARTATWQRRSGLTELGPPCAVRALPDVMESLSGHQARLRRIVSVLATTRQGVEQWFDTLPPGFPPMPGTHKQDREFLFRIQRGIIREYAQQVANLAASIRAEGTRSVNRPFPTPTVAFRESPDPEVTHHGDHLAIFCPRYFQELPRYLVAIVHECAHGFLPAPGTDALGSGYTDAYAGPFAHAAWRIRNLKAGEFDTLRYLYTIVEVLADCIGLVVAGPGSLPALLMHGLPDSRFGSEAEPDPPFDHLLRCEVLLRAARDLWGDELEGGVWADAFQHVDDFLEASWRAAVEPASFPSDPETRREIARLQRLRREVLPIYVDLAKSTLRVLTRPEEEGSEVWRFTGTGSGPNERDSLDDVATRLVGQARQFFDSLASDLNATVHRKGVDALGSALRLSARPPGSSSGPGATPRFVRLNTCHLLWARWLSRAQAAAEAKDWGTLLWDRPDELRSLVFYFLAIVPGEPAGLQVNYAANYFGGGTGVTLSFFDTDGPRSGASLLSPPGLTDRWYHVLGRYDFVTVVPWFERSGRPADSTDIEHFGSPPGNYYVRQQELQVLPRDLDAAPVDPGWLESIVPKVAGEEEPIFQFIVSLVFSMPVQASDPDLRARGCAFRNQVELNKAAAVRGVFRTFTWAELAFWVSVEGTLAAAVRAICDASSAVVQQGEDKFPCAAQTHTTALIRWTERLRALDQEIQQKVGSRTRLDTLIDQLVAAEPPPNHAETVRFVFQIWLPRAGPMPAAGRGTTRGRAPPSRAEVRTSIQAITEVVRKLSPRHGEFIFLEALGDEDFIAALDMRPRGSTSLDGQAETALLLLYLLEAFSEKLGACEVSTHVTLRSGGPPR